MLCSVDVTDSGEGDMEISVCSALPPGGAGSALGGAEPDSSEAGRCIPNQVTSLRGGAMTPQGGGAMTSEGGGSSAFGVAYTPRRAGRHLANVLFNGRHVVGRGRHRRVILKCNLLSMIA